MSKHEVKTKLDILDENLFGNAAICKNKQSIFFPNWSKSGITKIKDIWNDVTNNWHVGITIFRKLKSKRNWIAEFEKIKSFIPESWRKSLKQETDLQIDKSQLLFTKNIMINTKGIFVNKKSVNVKKLKEKDLYHICLYPIAKPKCIESWQRTLGVNENVNTLFELSNYHTALFHRKGRDLHWKILHKAVFSEEKLRLMNKSDGICKVCKTHCETLSHLFYDCSIVLEVWNELSTLLSNVTEHVYSIDAKNIITGFTNDSISDVNHRMLYNFVTIITKWQIWKHRNNVKFGTSDVMNPKQLYDKCILNCISEIDILAASNRWTTCNDKFKHLLMKLINIEKQ